jgi:IgA peptidase M64
MRIALSFSVFLALSSGSVIAEPVSVDQRHDGEMMDVFGCFGDAHGNLSGGITKLPMDAEVREFLDAMDHVNQGAVDNRVDLVFVGDGYTAGEMGQFHSDADGIVDSLYQYEPFKSYQPYFRVTKVEVISNESGVDNDPNQGVSRDTALDMSYWCSNIERLLCVNVGKAYTAAAAAPDIDQVVAISNSSKYGGAGYPSNNLGTAAGQNSAAADIAIHELGHSLGDLADEYTYGGPTTYTGNELTPVDVSIYDRSEQIAQERKWHYWMDASMTGFDGPISAPEGGNYSQFGVYRPSNNSMMRSLGRPFNLVSAERLLRQIYREVNPIDDGTPDGSVIDRDGNVWVTPMQPLNHNLLVYWYLDDVFQIGLFGQNSVDIASLGLDDQSHELRVEVIDETPWVRKQLIRDNFMTESRIYTIEASSSVCVADLNGDGSLNFLDVSQYLTLFGQQDPIADMNDDGSWNFLDVSGFLGLYSAGCP